MILKDSLNPNHTAMGRYSKELDCLVPVIKPAEGLWGIFPKNSEQAFAIDALLNDEIKLVSLGITLRLADVFAKVEFTSPRLRTRT